MEPITAYHVVTDRPMIVGQHIIFDEDHHSGVYSRVMALADTAADVYAHPEKYKLPLEHHLDVALRELAMEEVRREKYPLPLEHHLDVALRELAMEEVRREKYPQYPSRMACLYVSRELEEARRWGEFFARIGRPTYAIVELKITGRVFVGNACNCFDGTPDQAENLANADHYWQNLPNEDNECIWEMLADGDIEVVRVVEEINANLPDA